MKQVKTCLQVLLLSILFCGSLHAQNAAAYQAQYTNPLVRRILNLDKTVRDHGAIVGMLTAQDLTRLPLGIMDPSGKVVICIDSAKFTPNGSTFNAYAAIELPGMKEKMCFRAVNIPMGPNGITAMDAPALTLVSTHVLQLGNKVDLVVPGTGGNNIRWDCSGFKEINIEGKFVFKDGFFMPDKVEAPNDSTVTASVKFEHITNINNMMASVSITPFKIRGMEDFAFKVTDATVDMSDHNNPVNFQFPAIYQNEYGANANLWRGFFLRNLTVRLPFDRGTQKASLSAMNMLIDENGVTGVFAANNVIDINTGNMSGWAFSIDTIRVELLRNRLTGGSMAGGLNVPFLGSDSLGYRAAISQWNDETSYLFQLGLREDKIFKTPFKTKAVLRSDSYVQVEKYGDSLEPTAYLNGMMGSEDTSVAKFSGIRFENVLVNTRAPYIYSGTFSLTDSFSTPSLGGFSISLSHIAFGIANGEARLNFRAGLGFMDQQSQGFGVEAGFVLKAGFVNQTTPVHKQYWEYRGLDISRIALTVNTGSFKLNGEIDFYRDDPVYGNGFHGGISMAILPSSMNLQVAAQAYFGNKTGLRYFQVSGYVGSNTFRVPIVPGVLDLNGFLGGISWHMKRADQVLVTPVMVDTSTHQPVSDMSAWARQVYAPDANSGLGIMVGTSFIVGSSDKMCTGSVALEVGLNTNWGLNFVELKGLVSLFKDIKTIPADKVVSNDISNDAFFRGSINILYDAPNRTLHSNAITYLNVAGKVVGEGTGGRVGELVIHISPSSWYLYVGRPSSPMGVKVQLKNSDNGLATVQAYFMVGSVMEPYPAPPNEVLQNISYTPAISAASLQQGAGVAFGARFSSSFGFGMDENSKSWIYGGFVVGAGVDVMLSASGNYTCNSEAVGFGGWWARGQAYAYIQGAIGIRVKVFGKKRKFSIATLAAGLLLEAKIPKPSYFRGFGYVSYNILGGLIKGKANFKVQVGEDCAVVSNSEDERDVNLKVLAGTYPAANQNNLETYTGTSLITNIPVNQNFTQMDSLGNEVTYKVFVEYFRIKQAGQIIPGTVSYSEGNKLVLFRSTRNLLPDLPYQVEARLAYRKQLDGGAWTNVQNDDGSLAREDTSFTFRTGPPANMISMVDIDYACPFSDMKNFYKNEYAPGGYMKISSSVNLNNVFFLGSPGSGVTYSYKIKIKSVTPGNTETFTKDFTRNGQMLNFQMPDVQKGNVYRLSLVRIANNGQNSNPVNNQQQTTSQQFGADSLVSYSDTIVSNVISGNTDLNEVEMFSYHFRVSKYNTFAEKLNSMSNTENLQDIAAGNVIVIGNRRTVGEELFDDFELQPLNNSQTVDGDDVIVTGNPAYTANFPMIRVKADTTSNWLQQDMYPLVYPNPGASGAFYSNNVTGTAKGANPNPVSCSQLLNTYTGIVPTDKVTIEHTGKGTSLPHSDAYERLTQFNSNSSMAKLVVKYNLPYFMNLDFQQMYLAGVCEWVRALTPDKTPVYNRMVETGGVFPQILSGTYKVKVTYTLPGNVQSVTKEIDINY